MTAFPCCQCPEPPGYDPEVDDPLPKYRNKCGCPTATLECVSEQKVASLCGWEEIDSGGFSPSSPPKAYKVLTIVGSGTYTSADGRTQITQLGTVVYENVECSRSWSSGAVTTHYEFDVGGPFENIFDTDCIDEDSPVPSDDGWYALANRTILSGLSCKTAFANCRGGAREELINTYTISEEDTEADALARATATAGTDCTSIYQLRTTSFSFTVRTATYSVTANNLCKGRAYEGCVRLQRREAYSGTEPEGADTEWEDIAPDTIASFTATAKEMEIETDVALPGGTDEAIGYEYRAVSAHVWPVSAGCDCPTDYAAP